MKTDLHLKIAQRMGYTLDEGAQYVESIVDGLERNQEVLGQRYCPCICYGDHNPPTKDHICPCKEFREQPAGTDCHCLLYKK